MNTTTWICDTCGQLINSPEQGWVEWLSDDAGGGRRRGHGLRLVHHSPFSPRAPKRDCQYVETASKSIVNDLPLEHYLGPDGLTDLLAFLAEDEIAKDEVLEMIKRLYVPGYEHARHHFDAAIADGVFEPNTMPGYYSQHDINAVLEWLKTNDRNA